MLACATDYASIISQNTNQPGLPDFRNLGTILLILVAVNAGAALYAFAREGLPPAMFAGWMLATAVVEPYLFMVLAVLWLVSPRLARLPFALGAGIVALVTMAVGVILFAIFYPLETEPLAVLLRWLLWALFAMSALTFYFRLRARALSPAFTEARLQALQARIRPHFLFNSINAVLSLVRKEPRRAETALQDMADLFRVLMRDNRDPASLATRSSCAGNTSSSNSCAWATAPGRMEREEHARRCARAAAGPAAAARKRRVSRHRAVKHTGHGVDQFVPDPR